MDALGLALCREEDHVSTIWIGAPTSRSSPTNMSRYNSHCLWCGKVYETAANTTHTNTNYISLVEGT